MIVTNNQIGGQTPKWLKDDSGNTVLVGNDTTTITAATVTTWRQQLAAVSEICRANNIILICRAFQPANPIVKDFGATDALRVAFNAEMAAACRHFLDYSTPVSGVTDGDGQVNFAVGMTNDDIHQSDAGIAAQVAAMSGVFPVFL